MQTALQFLIRHGYSVVFLWVFGEQAGLPIPAAPMLLAAGSLASMGSLHFVSILLTATLACVLADTAWFVLGRVYGGSVLKFLCRVSLEPDSCVRQTDNLIGKHGARLLLFAKFVPGLNTVAVPIAGRSRISLRKFLVFDAVGALIWVAVFTIAGGFSGRALQSAPAHNLPVGTISVLLIIFAVAGYIGWKIRRRQKFLSELRVAKITPQELMELIDTNSAPFIVDLRHPLDLLPDPRTLPGALKIAPEEIELRIREIPEGRDIVLFCTCPNEATSAKVALQLKKLGITRVRPLEGGYYKWRDLGYPLEDALAVAARSV